MLQALNTFIPFLYKVALKVELIGIFPFGTYQIIITIRSSMTKEIKASLF